MVRPSSVGGGTEDRATPVQLRLPELPDDAGSYAVFDLETTGLNPGVDHIIEIGWCVVRDRRASAVRSVLVLCPTIVPAVVEELTGITSAMLERDGVPLADALETFLSETDDLPLVGHNTVRFDTHFLESACRRAGLPAPARTRYRDTAALYKARRLGLKRGLNQDHWTFSLDALGRLAPGVRYALPACCTALGISLDGIVRHRAAGDVTLTQLLYARLTAPA